MTNATLVVDTLSNLEMIHQIADLKGVVEAAANAFQQITMHCAKVICHTSISGPEISGILQLAQEHHMLSESALQQPAAYRTEEVTR